MADQQDELLQLYDSVRAKYGILLGDFSKDEDYIDGDFGADIVPDSWADDGLKIVKLPTISDAIDNAVDHILTTPTIMVPERRVSEDIQKARDISESKREFLDTFWDRAFYEDGDPLGHGKKSLIKGKVVFKKEIDWKVIPAMGDGKGAKAKFRRDIEKVGRSKFLWKLRVVPKETVFEDLANPHDPSFVFEAFDITVTEARRRFPSLSAKLADRDPMEAVAYIEYWSKPDGTSRGEYVQWIEEERVHGDINPYSWETPISTASKRDYDGYVPYAIGDPGFGDVDAENDPYKRYVSLTRTMRSTTEAEVRMTTEVEAWLRYHVFPVLLTTNMSEIDDGEKEVKVGPGAHLDITEDQDASWLVAPELSIAPFQFLARIQQQNDRHSKFGALGGTAQRGVDTATEADQNARNAATKLSGPVNTMVRLVQKMNAWVLMDVEKVLEVPVTLYGAPDAGPSEVTLTPRDIGGHYLTNVQLETSDEAALNLRNARTWSDLAQRLKLSNRTAMRNAGIKNPDAEMDEWALEQIESSPQYLQLQLLMTMSAFEDTNEGQAVIQGLLAQISQGVQERAEQNAPQQAANQPQDAVEQLRQQTQAQAVSDQPERQAF
jgi:hypothetical protein